MRSHTDSLTRRQAVPLVVLLLGALPVVAQAPLDVGEQRQLLMDNRFVAEAHGIEFRVHPPCKTGEIDIPNEEGWSLGGFVSVLHDGGAYHMWYRAHSAICYAKSADGVHWQRPDLNVSKIDGRPTRNLVLGYGAGGVKGSVHGLMVFLDPNAPASQRFRLVAIPHEFGRFLQLFSSADGIHWSRTYRDIMVYDVNKKPHQLDSPNVIFWDSRIGKYVAYVRRNSLEKGRMVARAESADLSHFGDVADTRVVFDADNLNIRHFDPLRKQDVRVIDTYTNSAILYPWADDAYFIFPSMYYHYGPYLHEFRTKAPVNSGVIGVRFASSRDGIHWNTYDWPSFVEPGFEGDFDSRRTYMGSGIVPAPNGHDLYMYYMGTNAPHGWNRDDSNNRLLTAAGVAPQPPQGGISRVILRRDGFVSVRAGNAGGEFTTPRLRFHGDQLVLNVDTEALGEVQVEVQDEHGTPIPGFSLADADIIHSANAISRPVAWNSSSSLAKLAGRVIRLHFVLRDADVYAFQFRERPSI